MAETDDEIAAELTSSLTETARALFSAGSVAETLQRIVEHAVETVDGCDLAGVFVVRDEEVTTPAYSDGLVVVLDALTQAFDLLRPASQHLNVKLRDVARTLVDTGETPPQAGKRPSPAP